VGGVATSLQRGRPGTWPPLQVAQVRPHRAVNDDADRRFVPGLGLRAADHHLGLGPIKREAVVPGVLHHGIRKPLQFPLRLLDILGHDPDSCVVGIAAVACGLPDLQGKGKVD
jgi:hypothetical protein